MRDPMEWLMTTNPWVMRGIMITLVSIVMTVIVVKTCQDTKAELTWNEDESKVRIWDHIPITVWHEKDYAQATKYAIGIINDAADCDIMALTNDEASADVRVKWYDGVPCGKFTSEGFEHGEEGGAFYCSDGTAEILIRVNGDSRTHMVAIGHEGTHILGLAHDKERCYITHPHGEKTIACEVIVMSRKDGAALSDRYCKKR